MTVKELRNLLNTPGLESHDNDRVGVVLAGPSIGGRAFEEVVNISFGFDWEDGRANLETKRAIYRKK